MQTIALPSVQSLLLQQRANGNLIGSATGFVVIGAHGPVVITNRHVVTGRNQETNVLLSKAAAVPDELIVWHNQQKKPGQWVAKHEPLYDGSGAPLWHEHPALGAKADFVALPLSQQSDIDLHPYDPSNPGEDIVLGPTDAVSVVGFPFGHSAGGSVNTHAATNPAALAGGGLFAIWATGTVAMEPRADYSGLPVMLIDCRSRQGQSGSPVIAYRGAGATILSTRELVTINEPVWRFIGVYSGRINKESDLGMVWKAPAVAELILSL